MISGPRGGRRIDSQGLGGTTPRRSIIMASLKYVRQHSILFSRMVVECVSTCAVQVEQFNEEQDGHDLVGCERQAKGATNDN